MVKEITSVNFDEEVIKSEKPVIVDFWAEWCGPCRALSPIIEELEKENADKYKFCKINIDDEQELAVKFGITSIPFLIVFKNGEVSNQSVGVIPKEKIIEMLEQI